MSDPFFALAGQSSNPGISDMLAGLFTGTNTGGGGGGGGFDANSLLELQGDELRSRMQLNAAQADAFGRMGQPPSKWATGAETFGSIAKGLAGLGSIYMGLQAMKQQKKEFEFNKGVVNTNLNNSITDYNRRLHDTLTNRSLNNGQGDAYVSSQMAQWQAKRS